jgi:hypothetical protein
MEMKNDPRMPDQQAIDEATHRLLAHLRAFYEARMKLGYLEALDYDSRMINNAMSWLDAAMANDVGSILQEIDPTLADG